jgi:hypothetical protein
VEEDGEKCIMCRFIMCVLSEGCAKLLDQRKQAKLQFYQNQSQINGGNIKNVRREIGRNFRKKEGI